MTAIYQILVQHMGCVAQGNSPDKALSVFNSYAKLAKGQNVSLLRNGHLVRQHQSEDSHATE